MIIYDFHLNNYVQLLMCCSLKYFTQSWQNSDWPILFGSERFPLLKIAVTLPIFHIDGYTDDCRERLNILVRKGVITILASLRSRALMLRPGRLPYYFSSAVIDLVKQICIRTLRS